MEKLFERSQVFKKIGTGATAEFLKNTDAHGKRIKTWRSQKSNAKREKKSSSTA